MPLSHFRIQASKAHINKPPKTSVRRVDPRREIPPALLPPILPLLVYVALSLLSSLSSKLPPIGILKFNSGAKAEATGWGYGRGGADVLRLLLFLLGPKSMAAQSLHSAVLSPHSHVNVTSVDRGRARSGCAREAIIRRLLLLPSSLQRHNPSARQRMKPIMRVRRPSPVLRPSVVRPPLWPQESSVRPLPRAISRFQL